MSKKKNPKTEAARAEATAPLPPHLPTETTVPTAPTPPTSPVPPGIYRSLNDLPGVEYFPARGGSAEATDVLRASNTVMNPDEMMTSDE